MRNSECCRHVFNCVIQSVKQPSGAGQVVCCEIVKLLRLSPGKIGEVDEKQRESTKAVHLQVRRPKQCAERG